MNQLTNPQATQLPAHLAHRQRRNLVDQAASGITVGIGPHISIAANRFTLVDAAGNEKVVPTHHVDLCIIDVNAAVSKVYYDPSKPFDPNSAEAPICFSDNGVGASSRASAPQHTSCQLCPHNVWGSAISKMTGSGVKACTDAKKMAVVVPGEQLVFLLRAPPASLKNFAGYAQTVKAAGADLPDVITRVEFASQGVLKFTPVGWVDEGTAALTDSVFQQNGTDMVVGRNDVPAATAIAPAPTQPAIAAPAQQFMPPPQQMPVQPVFGQPAAAAPAPAFAQPAPMAPPAQTAQVGSPAPFGAPTAAPGFGAPATAPDAAPKTRKPRTPKPDAVQTGTVAQTAPQPGGFAPAADTGIPPFLQRAPAQPSAPAQPAQPQQAFGMTTAPAPDAGMQQALDAAFQLPT